jgi:anti-anti-sigma factor
VTITIKGTSDDLVDVAIHGRLDTPGVAAIETRLTASIVPRSTHAILDLSDVPFVGSIAIRMFMTLARTLARSGHRLVLYAPQPAIRSVFETVDLAQVIAIADDSSAAQDRARGGAPA